MLNRLLQSINYAYRYVKTVPFLLSDEFLVITIDQYLSENGNVVINSHEIRKMKALLPYQNSSLEDRNVYFYTLDDVYLFETTITDDGIGFTDFDRALAVRTLVLMLIHLKTKDKN